MARIEQSLKRRKFIGLTTATAAVLAAPRIITASKTSSETIIGDGEYRYRVTHNWPQLPARVYWQTTHNVAVDQSGNLYVIHEGLEAKKDHPSIFVFDSKGAYVRSFGSQFQGGGHGIEVRQEGSEEFLYVCAYQQVKSFAKLTLKGATVWQQYAPMQSGKYAAGEDTKPQKVWGADRFLPTNFAFLDDGGFLLADGYGAFYIHRFDADGKWHSCFGGPGDGQGTFKTPHGIWIDKRSGIPIIIVADRAHDTLQRFTIDGVYIDTIAGFGLPANIDTLGELMLVPELVARVTLLGKDNRVVAHLGSDVERIKPKNSIRAHPDQWQDGKFVHPHDACFDRAGNIFVAEWVSTGRVSKLERVS